ncbi:MAG: aminotransferase class I/II-fold pyridoxal phosphate-dependent enzyme [Thermoplasmata archaeon]
MRFPLADWIDSHEACRYNLGKSGMAGTVRHPEPSREEIRSASEAELRRRLAELVGVHSSRVFLTHGATEANALVVAYLSRDHGAARCRVRFPEYPPLFDLARSFGYRLVTRPGPSRLAIVSRPRNPEGNLWSAPALSEWSRNARSTIVDETFREFTPAPSVQRLELRGLWSTGTFTKAYGGDDLRVGYAVAPESEQDGFARFHGLVADEMPNYSVAGALATLSDRDRVLREVRSVFERNRALWRRATPHGPDLAAPLAFDDPVRPDGTRFARRCLRASVLVSPGALFGRPSGVRVCLTRRTFPRDLRAYLRVRDGTT